LSLVGGRQMVLTAQIAKFAVGSSAHNYRMIIFIKRFNFSLDNHTCLAVVVL
jgi:hypothetical protein